MRRIPRYEVRALLRTMQGVAAGAADLFAERSLAADLARDRLLRLAYPLKRKGPKLALVQTPETETDTDE